MKKRNFKEAALINHKHQPVLKKSEEKKIEQIIEKRNDLTSLPEKLAGDKFYYINAICPLDSEKYVNNPYVKFIKRYFPYSKYGPLYIDEPATEEEIEYCKIKAYYMKKAGLKYIYILPNMTESELIQQLEDFHELEYGPH